MIYAEGPSRYGWRHLSGLVVALGAGHRDLDAVAAGLVHPGEEGSMHAARFVFDKEIGVVLVELLLLFFLSLWHRVILLLVRLIGIDEIRLQTGDKNARKQKASAVAEARCLNTW